MFYATSELKTLRSILTTESCGHRAPGPERQAAHLHEFIASESNEYFTATSRIMPSAAL